MGKHYHLLVFFKTEFKSIKANGFQKINILEVFHPPSIKLQKTHDLNKWGGGGRLYQLFSRYNKIYHNVFLF